MKTAEKILDNVMCCTIEEDADLDIKSNYYYQHDDVVKAIEQAQKEAFKDGQSSHKIKQLEWVGYENFHGRKSYLSKTPFSSYDVADGGDHFTMFSPNKRLRFASADEAKAAAQADFEKRIKECLE